MEAVQGLLWKVGRQCYAVLCLGVILVSVTIAHYVYDVEAKDPPGRAKTSHRLRALHGHPPHSTPKNY